MLLYNVHAAPTFMVDSVCKKDRVSVDVHDSPGRNISKNMTIRTGFDFQLIHFGAAEIHNRIYYLSVFSSRAEAI